MFAVPGTISLPILKYGLILLGFSHVPPYKKRRATSNFKAIFFIYFRLDQLKVNSGQAYRSFFSFFGKFMSKQGDYLKNKIDKFVINLKSSYHGVLMNVV